MKTSKFVNFDFSELDNQMVARHNPEWRSFVRNLRSDVTEMIRGSEWELRELSAGHFFITAFFRHKESGQYAYMSISDVRYFPNRWNESVLVRSASHERDYTGGRNTYCRFENLLSALDKLAPVW